MKWQPIETLTPYVWAYVPGWDGEIKLPGGPVVLARHEAYNVLVAVRSNYALVKEHAPSHWQPAYEQVGLTPVQWEPPAYLSEEAR